MIKSKLVFVIGAGASKEVALPLGSELAQIIANKLRLVRPDGAGWKIHDTTIHDTVRKLGPEKFAACTEAARIIAQGITFAHSVDDFLDSFADQPQVSLVGKLAITQAIAEAEDGSYLRIADGHPPNTISLSSVINTWYVMLMKIASSGVQTMHVEHVFDNVSFVSFNYDRCIEQFLIYGLAIRFNLPIEKAARIAETVNVLHPYGSLGKLALPDSEDGHRFGVRSGVDLYELSKNIKTYTEQIDPGTPEIRQIKSAVSEAETIIFLGFAFHDANMALLSIPDGVDAKQIFATVMGMSKTDQEIIRFNLQNNWGAPSGGRQRLPESVILSPTTCQQFMTEYQRAVVG